MPEYDWYIENSGDVVQPLATRKVNTRGPHISQFTQESMTLSEQEPLKEREAIKHLLLK